MRAIAAARLDNAETVPSFTKCAAGVSIKSEATGSLAPPFQRIEILEDARAIAVQHEGVGFDFLRRRRRLIEPLPLPIV